jgi:nitrogen PTS system EIIA component
LGNACEFPVFKIDSSPGWTKEHAIQAVIDRLIEIGQLPATHREAIVSAILKRESLGSTGIGWGGAIPHAKVGTVPSLIGAIGRFSVGIPFDSVDGAPVSTVCLLLYPPDHRDHDRFEAMRNFARRLRAEQ